MSSRHAEPTVIGVQPVHQLEKTLKAHKIRVRGDHELESSEGLQAAQLEVLGLQGYNPLWWGRGLRLRLVLGLVCSPREDARAMGGHVGASNGVHAVESAHEQQASIAADLVTAGQEILRRGGASAEEIVIRRLSSSFVREGAMRWTVETNKMSNISLSGFITTPTGGKGKQGTHMLVDLATSLVDNEQMVQTWGWPAVRHRRG